MLDEIPIGKVVHQSLQVSGTSMHFSFAEEGVAIVQSEQVDRNPGSMLVLGRCPNSPNSPPGRRAARPE
jgi:hypothetical protein